MRSEGQRGCRRRGNGVDRWSDSSQQSRAGWTGTMTTNYSEQIGRLLGNTSTGPTIRGMRIMGAET
jgi:hypothetical protein